MKLQKQSKCLMTNACWLALCLAAFSINAFAQDTNVDQTFDDCDQANSLTVRNQKIKIGVTTRIDLPALTSEVIWFCGGDRNRSASDFFFNAVKIRRRSNTDEFKVVFIKAAPKAAPDQPALTKVGTTKDGCDGSRQVRLSGKKGSVIVKAGESELIELASVRNQIDWLCVPPTGICPPDDVCDEHSANSIAFDFAQLERAKTER